MILAWSDLKVAIGAVNNAAVESAAKASDEMIEPRSLVGLKIRHFPSTERTLQGGYAGPLTHSGAGRADIYARACMVIATIEVHSQLSCDTKVHIAMMDETQQAP